VKRIINTPDAPEALGAYNQGVVSGNLLFTAGQIALTKENRRVEDDSIESQTRQVMANLTAVLGAAGCHMSDVVMSRIFIRDQAFFAEVNRVYAEYFEGIEPPARECVVAAPPVEGFDVEVSMIARIPQSSD